MVIFLPISEGRGLLWLSTVLSVGCGVIMLSIIVTFCCAVKIRLSLSASLCRFEESNGKLFSLSPTVVLRSIRKTEKIESTIGLALDF